MKYVRCLVVGLFACVLVAPSLALADEATQSAVDQSKSTTINSDQKKVKKKIAHQSARKVVNINTASLQELRTIKGISKLKAEAIINYREANGDFKSVDDLTNVKGINKKFIEKYRARLTV